MDGDDPGPFRAQAKNVLIPELSLRPRVGENERRGRGFDLRHDRLDHFCAEVAGPGKPFRRLGQQRIDDERLVEPPFDQCALRRIAWTKQHALRLLEIAERRREAPGCEAWAKMTKASERKLSLHAPLVA